MPSNDVKLGLGYSLGMFFHAPAGTALPAYPLETLAAAWKEVGDVSSEGISLNRDMSITNLRNWANEVVRNILTEHTETIQPHIMHTTKESLETILGAGATTEVAATADHGKLVKASLTQGALPQPEAYLFIMKDGDDSIAIGTKNGQITAMDSVTFAPSDPITWTPTITALGEGWQIILDDGQASS